MSKKIKSPRFQPFESKFDEDSFIPIARTMRRSEAWRDLTLSQRGLYLEMKAEYRPKKVKGLLIEDNHEHILFPCKSWRQLYGTYQQGWQKDRQALIDHGFIEYRECGKATRTPSVYALSAKWQTWTKGATRQKPKVKS